jgi:hypothetical protein
LAATTKSGLSTGTSLLPTSPYTTGMHTVLEVSCTGLAQEAVLRVQQHPEDCAWQMYITGWHIAASIPVPQHANDNKGNVSSTTEELQGTCWYCADVHCTCPTDCDSLACPSYSNRGHSIRCRKATRHQCNSTSCTTCHVLHKCLTQCDNKWTPWEPACCGWPYALKARTNPSPSVSRCHPPVPQWPGTGACQAKQTGAGWQRSGA